MAQATSRDNVKSTDAGQLLFYLVAHALKALKNGCYINELGLYTEGFQVCV